MSKEKLLIGVPSWNGVVPEAQQSFFGMLFRAGRDLQAYDVAIEVITRKEQFRARNRLVDAAIGGGFDWLLMLDDDQIVPHDLLQRLLAHNKDICGALYYQRGGQYHPVILKRIPQPDGSFSTQFVRQNDPVITQPGLHKVDIIGGGCMLFRVDIFRKLMPPYFESEHVLGTDVNICTRFLDAGVDIYCDTSIELGHVRDERQIVTSLTVPLVERELAAVNQVLWEDALDYLCMHPQELESAMVRDGQRASRQEKWHSQDRSTWEGVRAYYQDFGDWHTRNLLLYNLNHREPTKEWALLKSEGILGRGATVIDFGCGLGHIALPLAQRFDHRVHAVDIAQAPTLEFLRYRLHKHDCGLKEERRAGIVVHEIAEAVPTFFLAPVAGAFAISMIEHTWDPWGVLRWLHANVKPGGFLVCDYAVDKMDAEPQHLRRYDPATFANAMRAIGWHESLEHRWLFFKR